jgi:cellulose biosynthesis protein BcsQ
MRNLEVAVVSNDPDARMAAARAFDSAPISWSVALHREAPTDADVVVLGPDMEGEGIRFDLEDADSLVERIEEAAARSGRAIVVSGVGRGVGCTSIALHLAAEFARTHETLFVDLDCSFGAADRLGFEGDHATWADCGDSRAELEAATVPVAGGFRVLLAPQEARPPKDLLTRACAAFERVVVDCPYEGPLDDSLTLADAAVVVIPSTAVGARRLERIARRFERIPHALVANRTGPGSEVARSKMSRVIGRSVAVELPASGRLRDAEDEGRLFTSPLSRWRWSIARLAKALEEI